MITQFGKIQGTGGWAPDRLRHHEELGHLRILGSRRPERHRRPPLGQQPPEERSCTPGCCAGEADPCVRIRVSLLDTDDGSHDGGRADADANEGPQLALSALFTSERDLPGGGGAPARESSRPASSTSARIASQALRASSTDPSSSIVVMSPGSMFRVTAFSTRRMILPLRVLGSDATKFISPMTATGPSSRRIVSRTSCRSHRCGRWPCLSTTNAEITSPRTSSGRPVTPASATAECLRTPSRPRSSRSDAPRS